MSARVLVLCVLLLGGCSSGKMEEPVRDELEVAREETARLRAAQIEKAIMSFYIRNDVYPTDLQQLKVQDERGGGPDLAQPDAILDPWGQQYHFDVAGKQSGIKHHIDVWTKAASGRRIDNWTRKK